MIKLCMVNQIQRLGLAEHFKEEIEEILLRVTGKKERKYLVSFFILFL